ncbi:MAG: amino acid adenylation domain-containing protein [Chitinophagales bacterium]
MSGQHEIVLGIPAAGQSFSDNYGLIGHCVNLLPLRSSHDGDLRFSEYLKLRRKKILDDYDHQQITFGSLLKKINVSRDPSRVPLVPIVFNIDLGLDDGVGFEGLEHKAFYKPRSYENFEIFVNASGSEQHLTLEWSYNIRLYSPESIRRMMDEFELLLRSVVKDPDVRLKDISLWSNKDLEEKLRKWNDTQAEYPRDKTIQAIISTIVETYPDKVAIRFGEKKLSYRELEDQSNQLAAFLKKQSAGPGDFIGLAADRSIEMVIALLAILKAGAAYVPLDPLYPVERIQYMLEDSSAGILLCSEKYKGRFQSGAREIILEESWNKLIPENASTQPSSGSSNDLAYLLYTSGSTGKPKAVMVEHRNLVNLLCSMQTMPGISSPDKLLAVTTISFDIAGLELFLPLITGAELIIADESTTRNGNALLEALKKYEITVMQATPSTYKMMLDAGWKEKFDFKILCCGEPMSKDLAGKLIPRCRSLYNMYGPTETTIYSTGTEIFSTDQIISIGHPISNTQVYILGESMRPVPESVVGEIYIAGDGVARGYLNKAELTAEKFLDNPFAGKSYSKMYRTGDLGKFLPDGKIHCLGRMDHQVKIRGYRIELEEIEHSLLQLGGIREAIVLAREDKPENQRLVAYIVPAANLDSAEQHPIQEWMDELKKKIPAFMVPSSIVILREFPLTMSGKIDRKQLPEPRFDTTESATEDPRNSMEQLIAKIWKDLLGLSKLSIHDDFFALGGHSLIAAQVVQRLESELGHRFPLTLLFKYPVLEHFASFLEREIDGINELSTAKNSSSHQMAKPEIITVPAIEPQIEIWLSCILGGDDANRSYNISISERLNGAMNILAMRNAVKELVNRHESLRSTFSADGKEVMIASQHDAGLQFDDLSTLNLPDQQKYIDDFARQNAETIFDLKTGPLYRFGLFKLGENQHYLTICVHHIICDGWSLGILTSELSKIYSAYAIDKKPNLPDAPRFSQFATGQQEFYKTGEYEKNQQYWIDKFADEVPVLNMPIDFPRPLSRTYKSRRDDYYLDQETVSAISKLGASVGCSLPITMRTVFEIMLYRITGQNEVVLGLAAATQLTTGNYGLVGHCVNLLPLRSAFQEKNSFIEYLKERKLPILDAYDHQQLTFSSLLKKLNIARDWSRVPLIPVVLNLETKLDDDVDFYGMTHEMVFNRREYDSFEVAVNAEPSGQSFIFEWTYNTQLFKPETIKRMMNEYEFLLHEIIKNPEKKLGEIKGLLKPIQKSIHSPIPYTQRKNIIDLFVEQATRTPDAVAVVAGLEILDYRTIHARSNQVANYLIRKGAQAESLIPICIERSSNLILGILGILKAGCAYVPIDPNYPADRINYMLQDCEAEIVLSSKTCYKIIPETRGRKLILLDEAWSSIAKEQTDLPKINIGPNSLAYVMYTSGSTGRPKGVMIEHKNVVSLIYDADYVNINEESVLLSTGSPSFDATTFEYWGMLLNGGTLVMCAEETLLKAELLKNEIRRNRVSMAWFTSSLLNQWVDLDIHVFEGLQTILAGGEKLSEKHIGKLRKTFPSIQIINGYGPTENTTFSLTYPIRETEIISTIPIGRPIKYRSAWVLNSSQQLCPAGVAGELYVGGAGIGRGYLNLPDLTREKFIPDSFSNDPSGRLYRTGDLARLLEDGNIEYLGRIDDQVKIRGFRIELGEIESILQQNKAVKRCAVVAKEDKEGVKKLVAYIVSQGPFEKEAISNFLQSKLPDYMVPRLLIELDKIPLTNNGKADRRALPDPDFCLGSGVSRNGKAPHTDGQKLVADIWAEALGLKQVNIDDNFFELGGHSLIAVKVMRKLEEKTGHHLPITSLFEAPTVEKLSNLLDLDDNKIFWKSLVPIKPDGNKPPLYIVHGSGLTVLVFSNLAKGMDPDQPVYGLQARGLNGEDPFDKIEDIAAYYISEILSQNPNGPYCLAGYSFGGIVAFEMAKQLTAMGKEINMLAIFDTNADNSDYYLPTKERLNRKFRRQFPKLLFVVKSFRAYPKQTLTYQYRFIRTKLRSLLENSGMLAKKQLEEEQLTIYAKRIHEAHHKAFCNYRMAPYNGAIHLFRVSKRLYFVDDPEFLGWKPYALHGITVHNIPGDHRTFLLPPNDKELAKILRDTLNECQTVHESKSEHSLKSTALIRV